MQKNEFELNKKELHLRLALVSTIKAHVEERDMTKEEVEKVLDSLPLVFGDITFAKMEINQSDLNSDEQEQFKKAVFNRGK